MTVPTTVNYNPSDVVAIASSLFMFRRARGWCFRCGLGGGMRLCYCCFDVVVVVGLILVVVLEGMVIAQSLFMSNMSMSFYFYFFYCGL